ncbi:hypothetical protein [Acrocarpospora sp. B8E8]|uniref:hypothetical protein n=1 Tax=Acrocarpospora sp. B8E8 TaxID=3153572 RepID=UPI00325C5A8C
MHDLIRAAAVRESSARDSARRLAACNDRLFRYIDAVIVEAVWMLYRGGSVTGMTERRADRPGVPPPRHESDVAALAWLDQHHVDLLAATRADSPPTPENRSSTVATALAEKLDPEMITKNYAVDPG